jgi:GT2 family glycosyltransferase
LYIARQIWQFVMKKVSVVIINYNSSEYTIECVKSITELTPRDFTYEIIVVDNNSQSSDLDVLIASVQDIEVVKIVKSQINLGFSGGNMKGVSCSDAKYIFFLNNDCVLLNNNLSILYHFMQANADAGICTGQMFNTDMSFHHSFNYFPTVKLKLFGSSLLRFLSPSRYPSKKVVYKSAIRVPFVTGAAMFIDFKIFSEIGGFDTHYFLYCEEEDICFRLKKNGYAAYLVPEARFIHHMGKSTKRNLDFEYENYISLFFFFKKHFSYVEYMILKSIYFFKNIRKFYRNPDYVKLAMFILKGAPEKYSLRYKQKNADD